MRGPSLMAGYRGNPEATREAIDADGWLHTGDIGTLTADGALTIVDRKKELIITSGGKNVSPAKVESELKAASPAIAHACAVGDRRPYLTALLVLEPGADARQASRPRSRPPTSGSRASSRSSATRSSTPSGGPAAPS